MPGNPTLTDEKLSVEIKELGESMRSRIDFLGERLGDRLGKLEVEVAGVEARLLDRVAGVEVRLLDRFGKLEVEVAGVEGRLLKWLIALVFGSALPIGFALYNQGRTLGGMEAIQKVQGEQMKAQGDQIKLQGEQVKAQGEQFRDLLNEWRAARKRAENPTR